MRTEDQQSPSTEYVAPAAQVVGTVHSATAGKPGPFADVTGGNPDTTFPSSF